VKLKGVFCCFFLASSILLIHGCSKEADHFAVSADGVRVAFDQMGKGSPAIVFVHGWTNDKSIWDGQMSRFSKNHRAVAVDLAGSGGSGDDRKDWTMAAFGADVAAVIRKLDLDKVVLVGFSMGAPVVVETAKLVPERLSGLVLVDDLQDIERTYPPETVAEYGGVMMDVVTNPTLEKLVGLGFFKKDPEASFARCLAMLKGDSRAGWEGSLQEYFRWVNEDCLESFKALRAPVISINSDSEPTNVEGFRKYVPAYEAKIIPGTGHVLMWDAPEEFNRLLEESVREFESGSKPR
jgi:pimeloyl-ACP methyl ester carboxylesterase